MTNQNRSNDMAEPIKLRPEVQWFAEQMELTLRKMIIKADGNI